jgi:hypothetical protein
MDRKIGLRFSLGVLGFAAFLYAAQELSKEEQRQEVIRLCTSCHGCESYFSGRSEKSWELTVSRMNDYAKNSNEAYTPEQSARLISYLATYFGEDSTLDARAHFDSETYPHKESASSLAAATSSVPVQVAAQVPPVPAQGVAPLHVQRDVSPEIRERLAHPRWKPTRVLKRVAEGGGYLAIFCSCAMFITGHLRMRLKRRFRPIHVSFALGLFIALAAHAIIYLFQYGTPSVLWYWFGFISFAVLVLAQFQGLIRKRFGPVFLKIHVAAGYVGFTLAILHWVWAWM